MNPLPLRGRGRRAAAGEGDRVGTQRSYAECPPDRPHPRGATANYVAPGVVDTEMMAPFAAHRPATEGRIPACRFATPKEVAAAVALLASPDASYLNRAYIPA